MDIPNFWEMTPSINRSILVWGPLFTLSLYPFLSATFSDNCKLVVISACEVGLESIFALSVTWSCDLAFSFCCWASLQTLLVAMCWTSHFWVFTWWLQKMWQMTFDSCSCCNCDKAHAHQYKRPFIYKLAYRGLVIYFCKGVSRFKQMSNLLIMHLGIFSPN